jgi:NAD(P)H-hydrate repair Nnr-like enzyme with NAD(P)H-hydrate dehydratase domain
VASVVLGHLSPEATFVLDAGALAMATRMTEQFALVARRAVLMPNPTEAGHLLKSDAGRVEDQPVETVTCLVDRFGAASALRMDCTYVAAPGTPVYRDDCGHPALATSGSGDVLAGIVVGLLAQGAPPLTALVRGTHAHGLAGHTVAGRTGGYGILARELLDEIPRSLRGGQAGWPTAS